MPQLQLPIFPAGAKCITDEIAVEYRDKQVVYIYGSLPVFQHAEGDLQSFRLITSQLIDIGAVRQVDIVNAFGVPLPTVKRYLRLLRDHGPKVFFAEPKRRAARVLHGETRQIAERLIEEGRSVPEVAQSQVNRLTSGAAAVSTTVRRTAVVTFRGPNCSARGLGQSTAYTNRTIGPETLVTILYTGGLS